MESNWKNTLATLFAILLCFAWIQAQEGRINYILGEEHQQRAEFSSKMENAIAIPAPFAESTLSFPEGWKEVEKEGIQKITLVYTAFRESEDFNQQGLNKRRLNALNKQVPGILNSSTVEWEIVRQTKAKSPEEGRQLFHGFLVEYQPSVTDALVDEELDYLNQVYQSLISGDLVLDVDSKISSGTTGQTGKTNERPSASSNTPQAGLPQPANTPASKGTNDIFAIPPDPNQGRTFSIKTRWDDRVGYVHDTIWAKASTKQKTIPLRFMKDSNVLAVMERNQHWDKRLIVVDVTQSMSPYTVQVLAWFKQNPGLGLKGNRFVVLFNDGDGKSDNHKQAGETGGIYSLENPTFQELFDTMHKATSKARRNDLVENDVEGLVEAIENCPECREIILIADNGSPFRDALLIPKVTKPVRTILCGAEMRIQPGYLNLAWRTGGSVHTILEDIVGFSGLLNGDHVTIHGIQYELQEGKFRPRMGW